MWYIYTSIQCIQLVYIYTMHTTCIHLYNAYNLYTFIQCIQLVYIYTMHTCIHLYNAYNLYTFIQCIQCIQLVYIYTIYTTCIHLYNVYNLYTYNLYTLYTSCAWNTIIIKNVLRDFSGGPLVKTPHSQSGGPRLNKYYYFLKRLFPFLLYPAYQVSGYQSSVPETLREEVSGAGVGAFQ